MLKQPGIRINTGFTLVELMVSVVIVAILAAIALPSYKEYILNLQIKNAAESIVHGLQLARFESVRRNMPTRFVLDESGPGWSVCTLKNTADGTVCDIEIQSNKAREGASTLVAVTPGMAGIRNYDFDSMGIMKTAISGGASTTQFNIDVPSLPSNKTRDLRVVIGVGGMTRICDPNIDPASQDPRKC